MKSRRCGRFERAVRGGRPGRLADDRRPAVVEEFHRQVADHLAAIAKGQAAGIHEPAQVGGLDALAPAELLQRGPFVVGDGQDHPLLGLGDPDLGVGRPGVLERGTTQLDVGPELGAHLADGRAEAAGAAVGDRAEKPSVARLDDHVEHHLLRDRVADLDGAARDALAGASQLGRAEGRPVDAVAAGPPADGDDPVAGLDALRGHAPRQDADRAAEDQRVGQVARIDRQGTVDRRDAHAVAVVAHAGDDSLEDALRVEDAGREAIRVQVGRGHAEDIRVADRLGPEARPERIADDAAQPRIRPAVGIDGRRVVVRLDLEADVDTRRRTG